MKKQILAFAFSLFTPLLLQAQSVTPSLDPVYFDKTAASVSWRDSHSVGAWTQDRKGEGTSGGNNTFNIDDQRGGYIAALSFDTIQLEVTNYNRQQETFSYPLNGVIRERTEDTTKLFAAYRLTDAFHLGFEYFDLASTNDFNNVASYTYKTYEKKSLGLNLGGSIGDTLFYSAGYRQNTSNGTYESDLISKRNRAELNFNDYFYGLALQFGDKTKEMIKFELARTETEEVYDTGTATIYMASNSHVITENYAAQVKSGNWVFSAQQERHTEEALPVEYDPTEEEIRYVVNLIGAAYMADNGISAGLYRHEFHYESQDNTGPLLEICATGIRATLGYHF